MIVQIGAQTPLRAGLWLRILTTFHPSGTRFQDGRTSFLLFSEWWWGSLFCFFFKWWSFINCLGSYLYDSFRLLVVWPTSYLLFPARSKTLKSKPSDHHSLANVLLVRTDFRALISLSSCVHLVSGSNNFKDITWYFRCFQQAGQSWYSVLHIPRNDIPIRLFKGFIYYTSITKFKVKLGSQAPYINLEYNSLQYVYLALLQHKIWECCTTCA